MNNELIKSYKENLNIFLSEELRQESVKLKKISQQKECFKHCLQNIKNLHGELSIQDFNILKSCIMSSFCDATEDYWINRMKDLDIPKEITDLWSEEGYDFDMGINEDISRIITRFKGLANSTLYMDMDVEIYEDENRLKMMLEEETNKILKNYKEKKNEK